MKLGISNLAWAGNDSVEYESLVARHGVTGVEVAPTLVLGADPTASSTRERSEVRRRLNSTGLEVLGVQSLYFGRPELQLLGTGHARREFVDYTCRIAEVCVDLGGRTMVFGAPANRRRGPLGPEEAMRRAADTLHRIGNECAAIGAVLVPEALPERFGGDFLHTLAETAELVARADSAGIGLHVDTGASSPQETKDLDLTGVVSVQVSGGGSPLVDSPEQRTWAGLLRRADYSTRGWLSIELSPPSESETNNAARIMDAIATTKELYL